MKLKFLAAVSFFILNTTYAREYTCPKMGAGEYISIIDTIDKWYLYSTSKNTNETIMIFTIKNDIFWQGRSIEPLINKDETTSNLISCSADLGTHFVNIMLTVPESTCHFADNNIFSCH